MLPYPIPDYCNQNQQAQNENRCTKIRKPRKSSQRATRRILKKEFEKLLVPAFASKLARTYSDNINNKSPSARPKKPPKVLPDNLADFIIDNESKKAVISEDDYMQCMEILINTKNRKNQIMQICEVLAIDKESIRKKRKSRNTFPNATHARVYRPRKKRLSTNKVKTPKLSDILKMPVSEETSPELSPNVQYDEVLTIEEKRESRESNDFSDLSPSKSEVSVTLLPTPPNDQTVPNFSLLEEPVNEITISQSPVFDINCNSPVSGDVIIEQSEIVIEPAEDELTYLNSRYDLNSDMFIKIIPESLAKTVADYACMFIGL